MADKNTSESASRGDPKLSPWIPVIVVATALAIYANTLANGFVFDDIPIVVENPNIRSLSHIPEIFSSGYGEGTQLGFTALYRPMVITTLAINYALGELSPWHYHLFNCLFHGANVLLVVLLAFRLTKRPFVAAAAGLIFALHPVNTEAVAPVVGRTDLLSTFFSLGALLLYARFADSEKKDWKLLAASLTCLAGGLLSKEHAVVVPALVMLWDLATKKEPIYEFAGNFPRRLVQRYSFYIVLVLFYLIVRFLVIGGIGVGGTISELDNPLVAMDQPSRLFTAGKVSLAYLSRLIAPVILSHDYSYPQIRPAGAAESLAFIFVLAVFVWLLVYSFRKDRRIFFGLAFFAIAFSIVSNLFFVIGTIMAERLLYLPGVGFAIAAASLIDRGREYLDEKLKGKTGLAFAAILIAVVSVLFGIRTVVRNDDWRSQLALYEQAIEVVPHNAKVRMGYGQTLAERGRNDEAMVQFNEALELLGPDREERFRYVTADILFDIANLLKRKGQFSPAIEKYRKALELRKDRPEFIFNLGQTCLESGQPEKAEAAFVSYIDIDPGFHEAHNALALAREALGKYEQARLSLLKALEIEPGYAKAHRNLGLLYITKLGEPEKGIKHLEKTLEIDPDQEDAEVIRESIAKYHESRGGAR